MKEEWTTKIDTIVVMMSMTESTLVEDRNIEMTVPIDGMIIIIEEDAPRDRHLDKIEEGTIISIEEGILVATDHTPLIAAIIIEGKRNTTKTKMIMRNSSRNQVEAADLGSIPRLKKRISRRLFWRQPPRLVRRLGP